MVCAVAWYLRLPCSDIKALMQQQDDTPKTSNMLVPPIFVSQSSTMTSTMESVSSIPPKLNSSNYDQMGEQTSMAADLDLTFPNQSGLAPIDEVKLCFMFMVCWHERNSPIPMRARAQLPVCTRAFLSRTPHTSHHTPLNVIQARHMGQRFGQWHRSRHFQHLSPCWWLGNILMSSSSG